MEDRPEQRIGDRERRVVDDRLQRATGDGLLTLAEYDERAGQLWRAQTRSELDAVTQDLPPEPDTELDVPDQPRRRVWAVLSEDRLSGAVLPGQHLQATAVLGTAWVDLRDADLPARVDLRAVAVLGEVVVLVRPGVAVRLSGASLLGSRDVQLPAHPGASTVLSVAGYALLGSVVIRTETGTELAEGARSTPVRRVGRRRRPLRRALVAVALAAGVVTGGVAVAGAGTDGRAVFGSTVVRAGDRGSVDVGVLFGSVTVIVPDGTRADTRGTVLFGSVDCSQACDVNRPGRVIRVHGSGGFGSVDVLTQREYDAG